MSPVLKLAFLLVALIIIGGLYVAYTQASAPSQTEPTPSDDLVLVHPRPINGGILSLLAN
jgi:hypothetical protein